MDFDGIYRLCSNADTSHESVEEWYDTLGWHTSWESDHDSGQVEHPAFAPQDLRTKSDHELLSGLDGGMCEEERDAYESALEYAREALAAAESVVGGLEAAVVGYHAGDVTAVQDALSDASCGESEYVDDPAAKGLAAQLLEPSIYTYTIFDGGPKVEGDRWPDHDNEEREFESDEEAVNEIQDILESEAAGLYRVDGYSVGDTIHAKIWGQDGILVAEPTHELTVEDLGEEDEE